MKQLSPIHESLPLLASWYAGKFGVPIILDSSIKTEHTDGKTVHVPFINLVKLKEAGKTVSEINQIKNAIFGWTAHGCMHVRFTDFDVLNHQKLTNQQFDLLNIIEDTRIERECIKLFPGTAETLNALAEYMLAKGLYSTNPENHSVSGLLFIYSLYYLQSNFVEQKCLADLADKFEVKLIQHFSQQFVSRFKSLLGTVISLKSTEEVIQLVLDIFKMFEEEAKNSQAGKKSQAGNQDQSNDPGAGESDSNPGSDSSDSLQPENTSGEDNQDQSNETGTGDASAEQGASIGSEDGSASAQPENGQSDENQGQSNDPDAGNAASDSDLSEDSKTGSASAPSVKELDDSMFQNLKELLDSSKGSGYEDPSSKLAQVFNELVKETHDSNLDFAFYSEAGKVKNQGNGVFHEAAQEAKAASSRIRQKMLGLVQANQRRDTLLTRSGKRFDVARLHSIANGNTRIFRKEIEHRMPNTSVQLLVDLSGSMRIVSGHSGFKTNAQIAQETALALALALKPIAGVKTNVTYFSGKGDVNPFTDVLTGEQDVIHNIDNFFSCGPIGSTPLTEGLWFTASRLLKQKEDRKILFVITDGEPDNKDSSKHVMDLISKTDIKTIGIGINTHAVKTLFKESIVINDISDLQNSLFDSMRNALLS